MILPSQSDPTWQFKHSWTLHPSRKDLSKVLGEIRELLGTAVPEAIASKAYLTCDELLRNSLEHGCFLIGAQKKAELLETGKFEEYVSQVEANANSGWIELEIEFPKEGLVIRVRDSGSGYQLTDGENEKSLALTRLSQRGLNLIKGLTSNLSVSLNPTQTTATFSLS
jgi:hypothetical protein